MQGFNFTQIFLKTLVHYWWIFLLFIVLIFIVEYLKSAKFKGKLGEAAASAFMKLKLDPRKYKVFNNLVVNDKKGQTQIDHVVVSKYGIFVIEVKNYNGWIFGNENDEYWTQAIYNNKYKFQKKIIPKLEAVKA